MAMTKMLFTPLDETLHRDFKTACAQNGVAMTETMRMLIKQYIEAAVDPVAKISAEYEAQFKKRVE